MNDDTDDLTDDIEDVAERRARRKRGTGFPVVSLLEAARILKEAGKYGFEHPTPAFASYMGHSTTNSGAFRQRLSAFRDWELISGRGDMLTMTEVARMIAVPTDPDAERRAMQQAFNSCAVFARLYERTAKGQPLHPERLGGRAVHEFGVTPANASKFVESFVESALAAELAELDENEDVLLWAPVVNSSDQALDGSSANESARQAAVEPVPPPMDRIATAPTIRQSWPIGGGEILFELRSANALPATAFAALGDIVARLEALASSLLAEQPTAAADESES